MSHVAPSFHEVDVFWWFDDDRLSPYRAVGSMCIQNEMCERHRREHDDPISLRTLQDHLRSWSTNLLQSERNGSEKEDQLVKRLIRFC